MVAKNRARRASPRKEIRPLEVASISDQDSLSRIARGGMVTEASVHGFKIIINRTDFVPTSLRSNLSLDSLVGDKVIIQFAELNIEVAGRIARTKFIGKGDFELGIDYSEDAPEYWRECLVDLLPLPGEIEEM